jgi:HAE1 family hydrophobic/amphiphilic exporter-1
MIMFALAFFGLLSLSKIGVDLYPQVDFPIITIQTQLPGADPKTVETTVSKPIEDALSTISSIKHLYSTSTENISQVVIEFELEKNIDIAYQEVLAKVSTVRDILPDDIDEPIVEKADLNASPILALIVSGNLPIPELSHIADKTVKERLQSINGIGGITVVGKQERTIWIYLNPEKLEGFQLSTTDVITALKEHHIDLPGGLLKTGTTEFALKTKAEYTNVQDFNRLIVLYQNGSPIYLSDIGNVVDGFEEERSLARFRDQKALTLLIRKQSGMNTVTVVHSLKKEIAALQKELQSRNISLEVAQDFSLFIEQSMKDLKWHLIFGGFLAVFIVFLFLRNIQMTLISALALPLSVLATFILMHALGFTMNTMTMLALSLAIGILIDDAIVVIENIYRHFKKTSSPKIAARDGTEEIGLAAFAITMSIVAVFLPVAFMKGIIGRFFYQFGMTVAFSVLMSLFIAFTLTPMLASKFLKTASTPGRISSFIENCLQSLRNSYTALLKQALRFKKTTLLIAVGFLVFSLISFHWIRSEFTPMEDQSEFYIKVKTPLGSTLEATDTVISAFRQEIEKKPWIRYTLTTVGTGSLQKMNEGSLYIKMTPKKDRSISQMEAMNEARALASHFPSLRTSIEPVQDVSGGEGRTAALQIDIEGPNLNTLEELSQQLLAYLKEKPGYVDQDVSFEKEKPELNIFIKRENAAALGVTAHSIAQTIKTLIGGCDVSKFTSDGERYNISVRLQEPFRTTKEAIYSLTVPNKEGDLISLENLVEVLEEKGPVQIDRSNRKRIISVFSNLEEAKKTLGEAVPEITSFLQKINFPAEYSFRFSGNAEAMSDSFNYLLLALGLAITLVYMVLASQFESFLHPLTIMISLPFALIGAFLGLLITHSTLNIFTCIGLIMLIGLVTKNAILLVDYANTLREKEHMSAQEALLQSGSTRLIPILMTTLSMVFGMLPSALSGGEGSESGAPMAIAVIGGLLSSMFLTLLVVPVVYSLFDSLRKKSS